MGCATTSYVSSTEWPPDRGWDYLALTAAEVTRVVDAVWFLGADTFKFTLAPQESYQGGLQVMKFRICVYTVIAFSLSGSYPAFADDAAIERELDDYWTQVANYLAEGDYDGVVSTYHPDAVLVSESLDTSYPISQALKRWKPGILDTKAGKAMSMVEFRITRRLYSDATAHERGIFHFKSGPVGDNVEAADFDEDYVHFEALLLKSDKWTMVMESQIV